MRRRAFTLVELLVVIGIVAVLVGILLPTLIAARRQAELTRCSANVRELIRASLMFAQEHRNYMPLAGDLELKTGSTLNPMRVPVTVGDPNCVRYAYTLGKSTGVASGVTIPVPWNAAIVRYMVKGFYPDDTTDYAIEQSLHKPEIWKYFQCPSSDALDRGTSVNSSGYVQPLNQGTLYQVVTSLGPLFVWSSDLDYVLNEGLLGFDNSVQTGAVNRRLHGSLAKAKNSSKLVLLTDGQRRQDIHSGANISTGSPFNWDGWQVWTPKATNQNTRAVFLSEAFTPNNADPTSATAVLDHRSFARNRHKGRLNVGFVDGHVETRWIKAGDLSDCLLLPPP